MAVHNAEVHLAAALESICRQSLSEWQLIAVDDASTDGTAAMLDDLAQADSRVVVIHREVNQGQAACLNIGWKRADSELIARMDGDDICRPDRLDRQVEYMETHATIDVLGTGAVLIDEFGARLQTVTRPGEHADIVRRMYKEVPFLHPSVVIRRRFLDALGGYAPYLRRAQDLDLWLRGYRLFTFHNLAEPLIEYRIPTRPTTRTIAEGTFVLARSAFRERMLLRRGWYAPRYLLAALLAKLGLRKLSLG
jgi:glycosyltransferase involved in cell wall biosynthesis